MPCGWRERQIRDYDHALSILRREGYKPGDAPYDALVAARDKVKQSIGYKFERIITFLRKLIGLSPGEINLFFDAEGGFFTRSRHSPSDPWVIKYLSDDQVGVLLRGELTHELEEELMAPDPYLGE